MVMGWQFAGWQWLALALTTPVVAWGGYPFHRAALLGLRHRTTTMDTLVSLGTLAAYLWSTAAVLRGSGPVYFEVAAAVTVFQLAGHYAEARAKRASGAALRSLLNLGAKDAAVLRDGDEVRVPVSQLQVGDVVVVRPGERVATDGVIVDGATALDTSAMTGEPVPVDVSRRRHRRRRIAEHLRPAAGARRQGRRRHPAGPDGQAGQRRPERQGPDPADGRPGRGDLRAGGTADRRGDDGRLAARRTVRRRRRSPRPSRC